MSLAPGTGAAGISLHVPVLKTPRRGKSLQKLKGILRLHEKFALRNSRSAQDDNFFRRLSNSRSVQG